MQFLPNGKTKPLLNSVELRLRTSCSNACIDMFHTKRYEKLGMVAELNLQRQNLVEINGH